MLFWFASGLSLKGWIGPVLRCAVPVAILIAVLTLLQAPWAYSQGAEYHQRYSQRSDLSKISAGQFIETEDGDRVFFADDPDNPGDELGHVIARVIEPDWLSVITASSARVENKPNGDRFLILGAGRRYDLKPGKPDFRLFDFAQYGFRIESKNGAESLYEAQIGSTICKGRGG